MRIFILSLTLSTFLGSAAEPNLTEIFETQNQAYRSKVEKVLPQANFKVQWAQEDDGWIVSLKETPGKAWGGKITDGHYKAIQGELKGNFLPSKKDQNLTLENSEITSVSKNTFESYKRINDTTIEIAGQSHQTPKGWVWEKNAIISPTGNWLCLPRTKDVSLRKVSYVRSSPKDQLQPESFRKTYSKPGDELRTQVPVIFSTNKQFEIDASLIENPFSLSKLHWHSESKLWMEYIERGFGKFRLLELDTQTGKTRIVAEEQSDKFIHVYEKCGWWNLGQGQLLWRSEADGWSHLYLIDEESGERKQLTSGEWVVRKINRIEGDEVFFQLSNYYPQQDPYYLHSARLNIKTGAMTMLTQGDGTHLLDWSPDRNYYVDRYSRVDSPPVYELKRATDGKTIAELWQVEEKSYQKSNYLPERFITTDREGRYQIHGVIWKPQDFDSSKKYPVVENIYAGPHGAFVPKTWRAWYGHRSEMAAAGFVVVQIDGRGTNFRGQEFQQFAYQNLRDSGFPDRIKWMHEAAKTRPWMDLTRVGIYGGSAGGQSTLAGLLWHGDFYQAGVADCGCHDNRMDKIWWNEQWLDWPIGECYRENSNSEHVSRLKGKLLLTVGEVDTNVDPSSTYQVVDALIRADKDFEFLMVPNGGHGIGEKPYLRRRRVQFFQRHLGGAQ